ncbi:MAG: tRNA (guanosine(37)-N1)-methyltransferase TrmD, partial [Thermaurantiacus sp.]
SWEGHEIPGVLRSGDHARIEAWRTDQAEMATRHWRPDLWERHASMEPPSATRHRRPERREGED